MMFWDSLYPIFKAQTLHIVRRDSIFCVSLQCFLYLYTAVSTLLISYSNDGLKEIM